MFAYDGCNAVYFQLLTSEMKLNKLPLITLKNKINNFILMAVNQF